MNNYPSYLLNINLYALLSVYSVFAMLTSGLYSGDYLGMQVFSNGDSQYIMLLSLILILSQVSMLYSLMLVRAGAEPHDDSGIKYISLIVFTGITISYIGAIYFNYGVAGKFSESTSHTAVPRPPIMLWSSIVIILFVSFAHFIIISLSNGFIV